MRAKQQLTEIRARARHLLDDGELAAHSFGSRMDGVMVVGPPPGGVALRGRGAERGVLDGLLKGALEGRSELPWVSRRL